MEDRIFDKLHAQSSASRFLKAIEENDLELAKTLSEKNPLCGKIRECAGRKRSASHLACYGGKMDRLLFLDSLSIEVDWDAPNSDN
jgi:hypothetical protein